MKSTAHLNGHPIHPMLIPYPFALLTSAVVFDLGSRWAGPEWSRTAAHLTSAGLGSALAAAVPGVVDYFGTVPPKTKARRSATQHALCNVSALACFAVSQAQRREAGRLPVAGLALSVLGTGLLSLGGWLGGQLIYHDHVAVVEEHEEELHGRGLLKRAARR
jgi:uncharacterized membrane protein